MPTATTESGQTDASPLSSLPALLTPDEVGTYLKVNAGTLRQWRHTRRGPKWVKVEGSVRYPLPAFLAWWDEQNRGTENNRTS